MEILKIPFEPEKPEVYTDALDDLFIGLRKLVNYTAQILLMTIDYNISKPSPMPHKQKEIVSDLNMPNFQVNDSKMLKYKSHLPRRLFNTTLVQLVSHFEIYLGDLATELYLYNGLLKTCDKKLEVSYIFKCASLDDLEDIIIEDIVTSIIMQSYPKIVNSYENTFHIGIHSKSSPVQLPEVHNLIELRNIVVHNDGHASKIYLKRTFQYRESNLPQLLKSEYCDLDIDFTWLFKMAQKILKLGQHIDLQAMKRWNTSNTKLS